MKTISEIAKLCGVSRQSIYSKINSKALQGLLTGHMHKNDKGFTVFDDEGVNIISCQFDSQFTVKKESIDCKHDSEIIEVLKEQIKIKDNRIDSLMNQIDTQLKQMENMQILLKQEQNTVKLLEEKHTPFINKLFKKKDGSS